MANLLAYAYLTLPALLLFGAFVSSIIFSSISSIILVFNHYKNRKHSPWIVRISTIGSFYVLAITAIVSYTAGLPEAISNPFFPVSFLIVVANLFISNWTRRNTTTP
jgi:hypothetical protein